MNPSLVLELGKAAIEHRTHLGSFFLRTWVRTLPLLNPGGIDLLLPLLLLCCLNNQLASDNLRLFLPKGIEYVLIREFFF